MKLHKNKSKIAIGLLSGTSVDGIDAVLISISGYGTSTKLEVIDFKTYPIPEKVRKAVLKNSHIETARIDEICRLNAILGRLFADAATKLCLKNKLSTDKVSFIGSHGQTIHHLPDRKDYIGFKLKSTLQIGDSSIIAGITGITTVGDFRTADTGVDGDGAPLVPYLDYILYRSKIVNRALLNIGGISNITLLPMNCDKDEVIAFDSGPGNMLIDSLCRHFYKMPFDKDGKIAAGGELSEELMSWLKSDRYYRKSPPKSTGREYYGSKFIEKLLRASRGIKKGDLLRTVTEFTAYSIWYNYNHFLSGRAKIKELLISGGGAKNPLIVRLLSEYFKGVKVNRIDKFGIDVDNKEAVLFAVLANECLAGNSANMPSVTGAKRNVVLGKICQGSL